ncbi:MAG: hypothetical protein AAF449_16020 [Myxococcota bacterium]
MSACIRLRKGRPSERNASFKACLDPRADRSARSAVPPQGANQYPTLFPSDAKLSPVAKLVFRELEIDGYPSGSLDDHILNPDDAVSQRVTQGFADAFGREALSALHEALTTHVPVVHALPSAEFPIVFLPRPGGGDIQVNPLAPAEAYVRFHEVRFHEVREPYFVKAAADEPRPRRGSWSRQFVADKPQNIGIGIGKMRTRFRATMPRALDRREAKLYRYANGGRFPRWHDRRVLESIKRYSRLMA